MYIYIYICVCVCIHLGGLTRAALVASLLRAAGERPRERTLREYVLAASPARAPWVNPTIYRKFYVGSREI